MSGCTVTDAGRACVMRRHHTSTCDSQECTGCLPSPATRGQLCDNHWERTAEALRALPQRHEDLGDWLKPGEGEAKGQPRVSGTIELRSPLNFTIADHRDFITKLLASWTMLICETSSRVAETSAMLRASGGISRIGQLAILPPTNPRPRATAGWLAARWDWIAQEDFAGDLATEIIAADKRAYGLTHPTGRRKVGAGPCPEPGCEGTVTGIMEPSQILEYPALIECDRNAEHTWKPTEFVAAGERIRKQAA